MWRYKLVPLAALGPGDPRIAAWEAQLDELGSEGWEAVAVLGSDTPCVLFKMRRDVGSY
jgi:hypothetical protein